MLKIQFVPRSKHSVCVNQSVMYMEMIAVYYDVYTKHINAFCSQNVEVLNVS